MAVDNRQTTDDDAFDAGWAEATQGSAATDDHRTVASTDDDGQQDTQAGGQGADDVRQQQSGADQHATGDEVEEVDDADPDAGQPTPDRVKQELKTWQGRRDKTKAEAKAEETRLLDLRTKREAEEKRLAELQAGSGAKQDDDDGLTDEERETLETVREDYPTIFKAIEAMSGRKQRQAIKEAQQQLDERIENRVRPITESQQKAAREAHFGKIRAAHADYEAKVQSDGFRAFLDAVPYADGVRYRTIMKEGSADDVIGMLNDYTAHNGKQSPTSGTRSAGQPSRRQQQLQSSQGVRHRSAGITASKAVDPNDYDGAWEQAVAQDGG